MHLPETGEMSFDIARMNIARGFAGMGNWLISGFV
jgi:hypothetical protein